MNRPLTPRYYNGIGFSFAVENQCFFIYTAMSFKKLNVQVLFFKELSNSYSVSVE